MEIQQLEELSSAARLGFWPPHLLGPDEDKVALLGTALQEAVERIWQLEGVTDQNQALQEENDFLKSDVEKYRDALERIRDTAHTHVPYQ